MDQLGQFILSHWELFLGLVVVLLLIFINELYVLRKQAKGLSPQAAVNYINHENAKIFDLRDLKSFENGHIIDAICVKAQDFGQKQMEKYKGKTVLLVCARGLESSQLAAKLREQGFTKLMVLLGGMHAWSVAGLPVVK